VRQRIQKIIATSGVASRRRAEALVRAGRVTVNGVVSRVADSADPETDVIALDGVPLEREPAAFWLVYKPRGVLTTASDPQGRPTVLDLLPRDLGVRLFPVGRLDRESEGLILLTNDGASAQALLHPSFESEREYRVTVRGRPKRETLRVLAGSGRTRALRAVDADHRVPAHRDRGAKASDPPLAPSPRAPGGATRTRPHGTVAPGKAVRGRGSPTHRSRAARAARARARVLAQAGACVRAKVDVNLAERFLAGLSNDAGRAFLEGDGGRHSGAAIAELARCVAAGVRDAGVRPGERVAVSLPKTQWLPAVHVGVLAAGAAVLPINPSLPDAEIAALLRRSGAVLAVSDGALAARARRIAAALPWWCAGEPAPPGASAIAAGGPAARDVVPRRADDLALLAFTSGTTGQPKGVPLSHGNLSANLEALERVWEWTRRDRLLHVLPVFHLHGLGVALYGSLWVGNAIRFHDRFDAGRVLREAAEHRPTLLMTVPTMLHRLVEAATPEQGRALASLRLVVCGSAPLVPSLFARFRDRFGFVPVERFGMTETVMNTSSPVRGARKAGSVGVPLPGVEVSLRDPEAGTPAGRGPAEVCVRGPNVFRGYWQDDDATGRAFYAGGWFRTGDIGNFDADGSLRLVGRVKEIIVTGGYNVSPLAVEAALAAESDPRIDELAVGAVPDPDLGEKIVVFVVAADTSEAAWDRLLADLRQRAEARLPRHAQPRGYRRIDRVPRNAMGKVQRARLASAQGRREEL
jgi:malonyl-CoA/methylmalonyl-CoA synthetase